MYLCHMKSFKCDICNTILPDEIRLEKHMNVHRRKRRKRSTNDNIDYSVRNMDYAALYLASGGLH